MFNFELVYVLEAKHKGPDRLSRKRVTDSKDEKKGIEEIKDWIDKIIGSGVWMASWFTKGSENLMLNMGKDI